MDQHSESNDHLYSNSDLFKVLFKGTSTINIVLNSEGEIILFNPAAEKMTGYTAQEVQNTTPWALFFDQQNADRAHQLFQSISILNASIKIEMELESRSGEKRLVQWDVHGVNVTEMSAEFIVITGIDISSELVYKLEAKAYAEELEKFDINHVKLLQRSNQHLNRLSQTDHLTNLYNRRYFDDVIKKLLQHSKRGNKTISLLLCDVDHFKRYNDTYGHVAGDLALKQTAAILSGCSQRLEDVAARYGGEEFALILPGTDSNGALNVATCIMNRLAHKNIIHEASPTVPHLTMSIGIVTTDISLLSDGNDLIKLADQQLYEAKAHGRNNIMSLNHIANAEVHP